MLLPKFDFHEPASIDEACEIMATYGAKAKLLVLCYPNSPTGKTAPPEFYEQAIQFAKQNDVVVTVDPKTGNPISWHGVTTVKPNRLEAFECAGIEDIHRDEGTCSKSTTTPNPNLTNSKLSSKNAKPSSNISKNRTNN